MTRPVDVVRIGADRLDELEPLWRALVAHHTDVNRGEWPMRDPDEAWERRRATYAGWLERGEVVILVAELAGQAVGYASLRTGPGPASWDLGDRVAEIETLSVAPHARGAGVGTALVAAARDEGRTAGAGSLSVGLLHANDGAHHFYEREGFRDFYVEMVARL